VWRLILVRAFFPQTFPGHVETNTNFPPQSTLGVTTPPPTIGSELVEEVATVFDNLIYDDGTETGQVRILGG
jgi:hypothetical protein